MTEQAFVELEVGEGLTFKQREVASIGWDTLSEAL